MSAVAKTVKTYSSNYTRGECDICCANELIIPCKVCEKEACKTCIRRYIIDSNSDVAKCMYCSCVYTRETLIDMLGKTFIYGEYTKHINEVVVKNHTQLLHTFQPQATREMEKTRLKSELDDLNLQMKELKSKILNVKHEISYVNTGVRIQVITENRPCPVDNCNGFLNTDWKCGICLTETCSSCLEVKLTDHICDEGVRSTVELLKKETKPCPNCCFSISKIEGCDQMFCTSCNTAFSWRTGKIEVGRIHNPHYYEYLRKISPDGQIRREEGDGQCGVVILTWRNPIHIIFQKLIVEFTASQDEIIIQEMDNLNRAIDFFRTYMINIIDYVETVRGWNYTHRAVIGAAEDNINKASVDLIMNKIDRKKYENTIILNNKKKIFTNDLYMLDLMLYDVVSEAVAKFYNNAEIEAMVIYLNAINSQTYGVRYVETFIGCYQKAKLFVNEMKETISSIVEYYNEQKTKIKSIYNKKKDFHAEVFEKNAKILEKLSIDMDSIPPSDNRILRDEIIRQQDALERLRRIRMRRYVAEYGHP